MKPVLRSAVLADAPQAAALLSLALDTRGPTPSDVFEHALSHGDLVLVMEHLSDVLAIGLGRLAADEVEIHVVAVDTNHRRMGVGRTMVTALEHTARQAGATVSWLEVRASNQAAQALYIRCGYVEMGRRPRYYRDGEDAITMRHVLDTHPC